MTWTVIYIKLGSFLYHLRHMGFIVAKTVAHLFNAVKTGNRLAHWMIGTEFEGKLEVVKIKY